jgi:hypothetical protein
MRAQLLKILHPAAFLAALIAPLAHASESVATGDGALQARGSVDFQVRIPAVMRLALLDHPATVQVTEADTAAGELLVEGPQVLVIANNPRGYTLQTELAAPFSEAVIEGLVRLVQVSSGGGAVPMPSMVGQSRPQPRRVKYRFNLAKGTTPGVYAWPLALSVVHP